MFNSRDPIYRNPVGAVKQQENVHFKIRLPRHMNCSAAYLIMAIDGQQKPMSMDMYWCGMQGDDYECWECDFKPENTGLYFYYFELKTSHAHSRLSRGKGGEAVMQGSDRWQLTVYDKDFKTPDWLSGGIIYQIFPDRFHSSGKNLAAMPAYRKLHSNWNDMPQWQAENNGEITNEDFFGGDLEGIISKLPYLKTLGISCIYLNPIFKAHSNHRYDTGSYEEIDPALGSNEDFERLCTQAKAMGMHVVIDGVFSHTGSDSLYFNRNNVYDSVGAYNSEDSPYSSWYNFSKWPDEYDCWWGFKTLPNVDEKNPSYNEYINGAEGIVRRWLKAGASGWRLDVADELPDEFLDNLRSASKAENPEALVMGEVWEDASTKTAYGIRRRYLLGDQLDTVMNYPFRDAIFSYLKEGNSDFFFESIESILENYPPQCIKLLMNHIGTHDTERAITVLSGDQGDPGDRAWQSRQELSPSQYSTGVSKLKLASLIQYTLPGIPSLYYGDEAGVEGYRDPFNRRTYPWDHPDYQLVKWYQDLGELRNSQPVLKEGLFRRVFASRDLICYDRYEIDGQEKVLRIFINRGERIEDVPLELLPADARCCCGQDCRLNNMELPPYGYMAVNFSTANQSESKQPDGEIKK